LLAWLIMAKPYLFSRWIIFLYKYSIVHFFPPPTAGDPWDSPPSGTIRVTICSGPTTPPMSLERFLTIFRSSYLPLYVFARLCADSARGYPQDSSKQNPY
jgi:hypothetical protein